MVDDAAAEEEIRWGLAVVHAAAMDNEAAAGQLVGTRLEEMSSPQELVTLLFGLMEAGAVYVHAAAEARGETVEQTIQTVGLASMQ